MHRVRGVADQANWTLFSLYRSGASISSDLSDVIHGIYDKDLLQGEENKWHPS